VGAKTVSAAEPRLDLWQRIYRLKLSRTLLLFSLITVLLFVAAVISDNHQEDGSWKLFRSVPWEALAGASLSVVMIAFAYEWSVREESRTILTQTLQDALTEVAESSRHRAEQFLLFDARSISQLLSDDMVDTVARAALTRRIGDVQLAQESYDGLVSRLGQYSERLADYRCRIMLRPVDPALGQAVVDRYFEVFVDMRYETTLTRSELWLGCVPNIERYNALANDESWLTKCMRPPTLTFPDQDKRAFNVQYVRIEGIDLKLTRERRDGVNAFAARHPDLLRFLNKRVVMEYRYSSKVEKTGHSYMQTVVHPTRKVEFEFDYDGTDIFRVNVFDFFVSHKVASIVTPRTPNDPKTVKVYLPDWVLPKSGVILSWLLESEVEPLREKRNVQSSG
jgi:hypothetical protein